jgi:hypothetical protein
MWKANRSLMSQNSTSQPAQRLSRQKPLSTADQRPPGNSPGAHCREKLWSMAFVFCAPDAGRKLRAGIRHPAKKATPKRPSETVMTGWPARGLFCRAAGAPYK